jgi:hypothetical protein
MLIGLSKYKMQQKVVVGALLRQCLLDTLPLLIFSKKSITKE